MSNEKETRQYKVLMPIALHGRREKGEILNLTAEEARNISQERIELIGENVEVEQEDKEEVGAGQYVEDEDDKTVTVETGDQVGDVEIKDEVTEDAKIEGE